MTVRPPAVVVRGLRKSYGRFEAVRGVDFEIAEGETFALLGPNGAGKSTTIEILEGYRDRDGGEVGVLGEDPGRAGTAWKARVGIVLQSGSEAADVTVREQLTEFARYYPRSRDVEEVIVSVGLEEKAKTRIRTLSGGQRRRLDVALGVIGRPELLFLDEPTTGFDPEARHQFWALVRSLKREGTTILLTTHYLDEAAQLSDRAAVIAHGSLLDIGAVDELGGSAARVPIVRWRDAAGVVREERTQAPGGVVARLASELGGEPRDLEVIRPSLEDIYLSLVRQADEKAGARADAGAAEVVA